MAICADGCWEIIVCPLLFPSYLKRFRLSALKIDKSFIDGVPDEENACAIAGAVVALAKSLKIRVVAEGVENRRQADYLREPGCEEMQGFYYSRPLTAAAMTALLTAADAVAGDSV